MKLLLTYCFLLFSICLFSQYDVKGTVTNSNGEPMIGASVFFTESQFATITDEQGYFEFLQIPVDIYELKITYIGYVSYVQEIELASNYDLKIVMSGGIFNMEEIEISANELNENSPFAFTEMTEDDIALENLGQDLPFLLEQQPSVVVTSDAGAGIGYTGLRVRGSDATRVNVTINGVPLNDSESHSVFWVNLPDFASSVDNIQIQRGVGPSTNGAGAFGATVGLNTNYIYQNPFVEISGSYGSFNTKRISVGVGTGLINDKYVIEGRYSRINSDGYVDRASSDLNSFYFSAAKVAENHSLRINIISGKERTYQSWNGVPESLVNEDREGLRAHYNNNPWSYPTTQDSLNLFNSDRTYNYYTYENQVDDYRQSHVQLIYNVKASEKLNLNATAHYTKGKGFFEQLKLDQDFCDYFPDCQVVDGDGKIFTSGDVVRRKWLDNDFYGIIGNAEFKANDKLELLIGFGANRYEGGHYGDPVFATLVDSFVFLDPFLRDIETAPPFYYYESNGTKDDVNIYAKANYNLNSNVNLFIDLQGRIIDYSAVGTDDDLSSILIEQSYDFFNPKLGLNYKFDDKNSAYVSFARSNREPVRSDFVDAKGTDIPTYETLNDIELGYRFLNANTSFNANVYFMDYIDQLVLTGVLNDVGSAVRQNVDKSTRIGLELSGAMKISDQFNFSANATLSQNKIKEFTESVADYANGGFVENNFSDTDIAYSPNIISGARITYAPIKELSLNWISKYVGSQFLDNTSDDSRKLNSYLINDIVIAYRSKTAGINKYELKLMVNNILDTKYSSNGYSYNFISGAEELVVENFLYPQAGINFLLGASVSF